jgi:hypothetical protein
MVLFYYSIYQPLNGLPFILRLKNYLGFHLYFLKLYRASVGLLFLCCIIKNNGAIN